MISTERARAVGPGAENAGEARHREAIIDGVRWGWLLSVRGRDPGDLGRVQVDEAPISVCRR